MLEFHHIGLLVSDLDISISHYASLFGNKNVSPIIQIHSQQVEVCFVNIAADSYIELVAPVSESSAVFKLLRQKVSYYHIGYKVGDIEGAVNKLEALNYKAMTFFNSEAFNGKRCIFLFSPNAHLIELIEK